MSRPTHRDRDATKPSSSRVEWDLSEAERELHVDTQFNVADQEMDERESTYFTMSRHREHYFSNAGLFTSTGFNYLKYMDYKEVKSTDNCSSPHFSVSHLSYSRDLRSASDRAMLRLPVLCHEIHDVTFELFAGDIMALLYTKETEVRCLIEKLSGNGSQLGKTSGELSINGHRLRKAQASKVIGSLTDEKLPASLTVHQYLIACSKFCPPAVRHFGGTSHLLNQLITTLALAPLCDVLCGKLGVSELQRVKIAAQLIRDPQVLVLHDVTRELDIYDMAFMIDYLRDWAIKASRVVVMAVSPPTIEILKMFSKVAIDASGRMIYFGEPGRMLSYFESINYPCPNFKNQCDYYVDLVTHDNLTVEASRESTTRIGRLAAHWKTSAPTPRRTPGGPFPPQLPRAGPIRSFVTLLVIFWFESVNHPLYTFSTSFLALLHSLAISLALGTLPMTRSGVTQRIGLVKQIVYFSAIPIVLFVTNYAQKQRRDLNRGGFSKCYGSFSYALGKVLFDVPVVLMTAFLYILPIYLIKDFHPVTPTWDSLLSLFFLSLLNFALIAAMANFCAFASNSMTASSILCATLLSACFLSSGLPVHSGDQAGFFSLAQRFFPLHWLEYIAMQHIFMGQPLLSPEASKNASQLLFDCERTHVLARKIKDMPIYTVSSCSKITSKQVLNFHAFAGNPLTDQSNFLMFGVLVLLLWVAIFFGLSVVALKINRAQT